MTSRPWRSFGVRARVWQRGDAIVEFVYTLPLILILLTFVFYLVRGAVAVLWQPGDDFAWSHDGPNFPVPALRPLTPEERMSLVEADKANFSKYRQTLDRESAYERLQSRNTFGGQIKEKLSKFPNIFGFKK